MNDYGRIQKNASSEQVRVTTNGPLKSTAELGYLDSSRIYTSKKSDVEYTDLACSICQNILWKPVACSTCENAFCAGCMQKWIENQKDSRRVTCPFDCTFQEKRAPPILNNLLSRLKLYCAYTSNGCQEILSYDALETHEQACQYERTPCRICGTLVSHRDKTNRHKIRQCFEQIGKQYKNQIQIQAQFMMLLDVVEASQQRIQQLETLLGIE